MSLSMTFMKLHLRSSLVLSRCVSGLCYANRRCVATRALVCSVYTNKFRLKNSFTSSWTSNDEKISQHTVSFYCTKSNENRWTDLSYGEFLALQECGDVQVIDVRNSTELKNTGSIPGSINLPLSQLKEALQMDEDTFLQMHGKEKPRKSDTNIVFSGFTDIKSTAALEIAHKMGYKKARHFPGGWQEWSVKQGLVPKDHWKNE